MIEFKEHTAVLLNEAVTALVKNVDGTYVDGTFGRGGHSQAVLNRLSGDSQLLAFDKDPEAIQVGKQLMASDSRFQIYQSSFGNMDAYVSENTVDGILLDLGVSSPQLDDPARGFSFLHDGPLDMRMDPSKGVSAAQWVNETAVAEMTRIFKLYGEERYAKRIAAAIDLYRKSQSITRTVQLATIVKEANPNWEKHKHPATRVFQAIRIAINEELADLERALDVALTILKPGGRLVVISFHSLEDRLVKKFIRRHERGDPFPSKLPIKHEQLNPRMMTYGKPIKTGENECQDNRRARSAIMRVAEKLT